MDHTGEERFRCVVVWMLLVIIILLSILCFSGCVSARVEKEFPDGSKITIDYNRYFAPQKFEGFLINIETGELMFEKQESDTVKMARGIAEGVARGLNPIK